MCSLLQISSVGPEHPGPRSQRQPKAGGHCFHCGACPVGTGTSGVWEGQAAHTGKTCRGGEGAGAPAGTTCLAVPAALSPVRATPHRAGHERPRAVCSWLSRDPRMEQWGQAPGVAVSQPAPHVPRLPAVGRYPRPQRHTLCCTQPGETTRSPLRSRSY